jgi:CubicO group peptidase (beta-lactamase class C family)
VSSAPAGISLDNWLSATYAHWSFQHVEDFVPTALISRGTGPVAALPGATSPLSETPVIRIDGTASTVGAVMAATITDGWAVAHRGSLVAEEYFDGFGAQTRHLLFSVSKSLVAAVVGALHGAGAIELDAPLTTYVPALADCGYAGATVRHLLDMRSGIEFSDNYLHPTAEIHLLDEAMGWAPGRRRHAVRLPADVAAEVGTRRPVRIPLVRNRRAGLDLRGRWRPADARTDVGTTVEPHRRPM